METNELDRTPNLFQLAKLLPVARRYNAQRKEHHVIRTWWTMRELSLQHTYLYLYTCAKCSPPFISISSDLQAPHNGQRVAIPSSYDHKCVLCNVIRCCYLHFAVQDPSIELCEVRYPLPGYIVLEFGIRLQGLGDVDFCVQRTAVQVYSLGRPDPRFPFKSCENVSPDPRFPDVITKVQSWLKDCVENHPGCVLKRRSLPTKAQGLRPSRLIRLDDDQHKIVCLDSPTMPVDFAALSYCWGDVEQTVTQSSNVSSRYERLHVAGLPQTHQDAIFFTRALGLNYLWIDSICIVQDDSEDWATEAAKMGDIYTVALVVLAATSASDSSCGFLHRRKDVVTMRPPQLNSVSPSIHARRMDCHRYATVINLDKYPLFKRAWCLQERELARRIVHFAPDELYMLCQLGHNCECGMAAGETSPEELSLSPFRKAMQAKGDDGTNQLAFGRYWAQIVEDYTKLNLTRATDVLPALAGLAQQMSHFKPGAYIAGIWEKDIACLLAWRTSLVGRTREALSVPTFSWTASSCPVYFDKTHFVEAFFTLCHYVSHHCTYTTTNMYGHVSTASLCLRGQEVSGLVLLDAIPWCFNGRLWDSQIYVWLDNVQMSAADYLSEAGDLPDTDRRASTRPDLTSLICFSLYSYTDLRSKEARVTLLLLQLKADTVGQYIRIGLATSIDKAWFDKRASPITVTIT